MFECKICKKEYQTYQSFKKHCKKKNDEKHNLLLFNDDNKDEWIECKLCEFKAKKLDAHITKVHNISVDEYKSKYGEIICNELLKKNRKNANVKHVDLHGENNPFYGKHHTTESRKKISDTSKKNNAKLDEHFNKNRKHTKETRKKMSLSKKGENNPMYGKNA